MKIILSLSIIILSIIGFSISFYIYKNKRKKKRLICPMRSSCDKVTHSGYSKFFGVPVEILGMLYYTFIAASYTMLSFANINLLYINAFLCAVSTIALFFSFYLFAIQLFVIKKWCTWCLFSAFISFLIFAVSYLHFLYY
jgi:uncharacterized membrane protein